MTRPRVTKVKSKKPRFTKVVSALPAMTPFVGPEAMERARGSRYRVRLGANESVFGPSPKAIAAMETAARDNWMYSDPENYDLCRAIADHHGVDIKNVVVGEGIDGLLGLTLMLFAEPGDPVVTSDGAYPTFNFHVAAHGARLIKVPFDGVKEDWPRLAEAANAHRAKLVYVSNPNNPMGTWRSAEDVQKLSQALPEETILIVDEAYADTAPQEAIPPIDVNDAGTIRYRTFSKAYGLAGARIGYVLARSEIAAAFDKVRNHYGINRVGQIGALAALQDQDFLREAVTKISDARERLYAIAHDIACAPVRSGANFVAINFETTERSTPVFEALLNAGVFVRRPIVPALEHFIRVSCGTPHDLDVFSDTLSEVLKRV